MFKSLLSVRPCQFGSIGLNQVMIRNFTKAGINHFQTTMINYKTQTQLKQALKKERDIYKKIKADIVKIEAKLKEKKRKEKVKQQIGKDKIKHDKLLKKAFKNYSKLSGMNVYVKEFISQGKGNLSEASKSWSALAEDEKDVYKQQADEINEEQLNIYKPKPKGVVSGVSAYVQKYYYNDGRPSTEIIKDLAVEFKALSEDEKKSYIASPEARKKANDALLNWKLERVELYNKEHNADLTLNFKDY